MKPLTYFGTVLEASDTPSSSEESDATISSVEKPANTGWEKQNDGYYNRKPNVANYFKKYYQEKTKRRCVCDVCGSDVSCKSNLAKHKRTKKCQRFLV